LAIIDTYLDESGIHDGAEICMVAGYYGGKGQFRKLEKAWLASLRDYEFPLKDSHATDLLKSRRHQPMVQALAFAIDQQPEVYPVSSGSSLTISTHSLKNSAGGSLAQDSMRLRGI
jgi:hypothetical protein